MGTTTSAVTAVSRALAVGVLLPVLALAGACGSSENGSARPSAPPDQVTPSGPGATQGQPPPTDGTGGRKPDETAFDEADQRMAEMVDAEAVWHAPHTARVDTALELGLSIGDGEELRQQVEQALPDTPAQPGIPLKVGTDVSARLLGDPSEVTVTPNDAIDASTGSDIALLWTWIVRPLRPSDDLRLAAYLSMTVPGTDHVITKIVHVTLRVTRTLDYTVHQVFTNWGTWVAIIGTLSAGARWVWIRRRRQGPAKPGPPTAPGAPPGPDPKPVLKH